MTQPEYEQKRRECWEEFKRTNLDGEVQWQPVSRYDVFCAAFDRAYALSREKETITQEGIEKAAIEYVLTRQQARHNAKKEEDATMRDFDKTIKAWDAYDMEQAFESGANLFLGKQTETITQEEIDKAAEDYVSFEKGGKCYPSYIVERACCCAFKDGANFALGKQEKDAEDTVIQGWVARSNDGPNDLGLKIYTVKPDRKKNRNGWNGHGKMSYLIDCRLFPDLTWSDEPQECEITLKRKKK